MTAVLLNPNNFLENEIAPGTTPLILVDGPPAEIKRRMRMMTKAKWLKDINTSIEADLKKSKTEKATAENIANSSYKIYQYTLGFGLKAVNDHASNCMPEVETDEASDDSNKHPFAGQPNLLLNWMYETCEQAAQKNKQTNHVVFIYDPDDIVDNPFLRSQLGELTDPDGYMSRTACTFVLCGPGIVTGVPDELKEQAVKVNVPLPTIDEIKAIVASSYKSAGKKVPTKEVLERIAREAVGMTQAQINNVSSRGLYEHGEVQAKIVRSEVNQLLADLPGVELLDTDGMGLKDLGGYEYVKEVSLKLISAFTSKPLANPKGLLLFGYPGTGKSFLGRCLGGEVGWKVLIVSPNELKDKYVGETGRKMARLLRLIEAIAPCIVILDEVDGAFGSADGGKESDSSGDMLSIFLTWQAERTGDKPIFVLATCNRMDKLPPEFSRDGRFNKRLWLGAPTDTTKQAIWKIHTKKYGLDENQPIPEDDEWTGAEIAACCEQAYVEDCTLVESARRIVPVIKRMLPATKALITQSASACLSAETGDPVSGGYKAAPMGSTEPPPPPPGHVGIRTKSQP